uniref:NADH-cytochrome b5 reductase n=1 Tax=Rhabditophanes sp. KR3021 TaxID=114890 RepID=A0AC35TQM6_9BILA
MFDENEEGMPNEKLSALLISIVVGAVAASLIYLYVRKATKKLVALIDPEAKYPFRLVKKTEISHDTRIFRFALPSSEHVLGLPPGQHINLVATINGKLVVRPYTPISSDADKGFLELIVKVYKANIHPRFPDGGKMSQYLDAMQIGDAIDFRGPNGLIVYKGNGLFAIRPKKNATAAFKTFNHLGMIAGGSGLTPVLSIIRDIAKNPEDKTKVSLLYANQSEEDILQRKELDELAIMHKDQISVWYTIDNAGEGWSYSTGFISEEMLKNHLPSASDDVAILMCGPPPMINFACIPNLDSLGHNSANYLLF